jgi:hypothetical protein
MRHSTSTWPQELSGKIKGFKHIGSMRVQSLLSIVLRDKDYLKTYMFLIVRHSLRFTMILIFSIVQTPSSTVLVIQRIQRWTSRATVIY